MEHTQKNYVPHKALMYSNSPLNDLARDENLERFNVFSVTGEAGLKVNCYNEIFLVVGFTM